MENNEVTVFPEWREAVKDLISKNPTPGFVIEKTWLYYMFGIQKPVTAEDQNRASLQFMVLFKKFQDELLETHKIDLETVAGVGYRIIAPRDQARSAIERRTRNIVKEIREMGRSIMFTNTEALSDVERKEHTDTAVKAASIGSMFNRRKLLGRG